ncbi:sensor histidine kinase [Aquipuribacter sp. SD81]|uniref:sensor histidine kinase n=1 Tax=Aquipuribacter sp. SD81 TaxID=3127703 RepID=UPI00301A7162
MLRPAPVHGRPGRRERHPWRDARLLPLAGAVLAPVLAVVEGRLDPTYREHPLGVGVVAALLGVGYLVAVRWASAGAVVLALSFPVGLLAGLPGLAGASFVAVVVGLAWAGWADPLRRSAVALGVVLVGFAVAGAFAGGGSWDSVFLAAMLLPSWWLGVLVHRAQSRARELARLAAALDAEREVSARAAVAAERTRIARDVHDAVAHSVSVMTLQVGGLRRQLDDVLRDRPQEREVMLGLEELGRRSVDDLRALVGILRQDAAGEAGTAPTPSLGHAEDLVRQVRAAGLDVRLTHDGEPVELPPGLDVSAYRVLQECLTNALRHAPGSRCEVVLRRRADAVTVLVTDHGSPARPDRAAGPGDGQAAASVGGHGLVGMRERVAAYGGTLTAAPTADGFRVEARFPVPRHR